MEINVTTEGSRATLALSGKLTVQTAPRLGRAIEKLPASVKDIDIDLTDVDYVASAGLRMLVTAEKLVAVRGGVVRLLHPSDNVMGVLDVTGLSSLFTVER